MRSLSHPMFCIIRSELAEYIEHVALLYKGLQNFVLTKKFLHDVEKEGIKDWLTSTEKRPQAFRTYFHDPITNRCGDRVSIKSNIINTRGAVEEWDVVCHRQQTFSNYLD